MLTDQDVIFPEWPAPVNVKAMQTTRNGGVSLAPFDTLNLAAHVSDSAMHVAQNRQLLSQHLPSEPVWLNQVHGTHVVVAEKANCMADADASFSKKKHVVCVSMTADCLPVLLCDDAGTVVTAIHAGWRGLCDGVIEESVKALQVNSANLMAWLGPAIGAQAFEVGSEVRTQFIAKDARAESAFIQHGDQYLGDIYKIARQRLHYLGITRVYGGGFCTYTDVAHFFSFRRDGKTGRMATFIWLG
jgi:YfiH family protein